MDDESLADSAIQAWCVGYLSRTLELPPARIDPQRELDELGLDSVAAVMLIAELEEWLGLELPSGLLFDYPTIAGLAKHLAAQQAIVATLKGKQVF